jgi:hypothetical protein
VRGERAEEQRLSYPRVDRPPPPPPPAFVLGLTRPPPEKTGGLIILGGLVLVPSIASAPISRWSSSPPPLPPLGWPEAPAPRMGIEAEEGRLARPAGGRAGAMTGGVAWPPSEVIGGCMPGDEEGRNTGSDVARSSDLRSRADRSEMSVAPLPHARTRHTYTRRTLSRAAHQRRASEGEKSQAAKRGERSTVARRLRSPPSSS